MGLHKNVHESDMPRQNSRLQLRWAISCFWLRRSIHRHSSLSFLRFSKFLQSNVETGQSVHRIVTEAAPINSLAWSPKQLLLAYAGDKVRRISPLLISQFAD